MRELDYKERWLPKNWSFRTVLLEKTLESPLDCKEIKLVSPKGNQPWIFIGRTDTEAEAPILWPTDAKNWFIEKDPDAGQDWRQEEKGMTKDEMVGWHHQLNGHESEQTPVMDTRVWWWLTPVNCWWWTGKPGILQSRRLQRVEHNWATKNSNNYKRKYVKLRFLFIKIPLIDKSWTKSVNL